MMEKKYHLFLGVNLLFTFICCSSPEVEVGTLDVIPQPYEVTQDTVEKPFVIDKNTVVYVPTRNESMKRIANFLISYVDELSGIKMSLVAKQPNKNAILLEVSEEVTEKEGYRMLVSTDLITIKGGSENGLFYAVQTLFKALPKVRGTEKLAAVPVGNVEDFPRFAYRGFMIDVGRHFFPVSYMKRMIDMMALHNINYFHWHLSEDQGWRIEIKKYPKLTEIGSTRDSTIIDSKTNKYDRIPHKGFYTQDEAREIVRYAADRFITVIPEIDMPGHMMAALSSYPELGCTGGPYSVPCKFGVFKDVLCAGNDQTLQFCKDVLEEVMAIFPSEYIHIGGDECPKARWKECPKCQAKICKLELKTTLKHSKENQLQTYFMEEMEKFINAHGRKMMGWDEILEGGLTPNSTVMSWRGVKGGIEAARQHHPVIMTPIHFLYFSNPHWNKLKGVNSVKRVYGFDPVPAVLTSEEQAFILGTQACIWTEWTSDTVKMEWQALPRMAALSEIQWTDPKKKDFESFKKRLPSLLNKYALRGYGYRKDIHDTSIMEMPADSLK